MSGCTAHAQPFPLSILISTALLCLLLAPIHPALALKLKFRQEECMYYHFDMYSSFYGSYVALPDTYGATARYMLTITSPAGMKVYENQWASEAKFNIVPYESGRYKFCLVMENARALSRYVLTRDVVWDLHATGADTHHDSVKEDETKHLWQLVNQIDSQVQQLKATQQYLYWRERRHRQTVESTNARVWWYAMARNAALVATSIGQVLFIRRMFAK